MKKQNTWQSLAIGLNIEKNIALMERLRQEEKVIGVQLVGGIGDQIEASMILECIDFRMMNNQG